MRVRVLRACVNLVFMNDFISKEKLLSWIDYMLSECYGDFKLGTELFGVDGYREGTTLLKSIRFLVNRGDFSS